MYLEYIRNVKSMCKFNMFITAFCVLIFDQTTMAHKQKYLGLVRCVLVYCSRETGHIFAASSDSKVSAFAVHMLPEALQIKFLSSTLESGFKHIRIPYEICRMRVDGSRVRIENASD